ncbi:hypothetical protein ACFVYD_32060 [Streptomyces sp. NPDC058301]|uniref:hypothetical protein n=1 Tax=Streptomyces sp. NPDC058301 TaxID=3346436 RepID=UPI0036E466F5
MPVGTAYIKAVNDQGSLTKKEWAAAIVCPLAFAAISVGAPNALLRDKNSPHAFTAAQMARHDTQHTA